MGACCIVKEVMEKFRDVNKMITMALSSTGFPNMLQHPGYPELMGKDQMI